VTTTGVPAKQRVASDPSKLGREQWISIAGMSSFILLLTVVGWGVLVLLVVPQQFNVGTSGALGIGIGLTAYMLGMRHAFDADHIAAIDNTTRKFMEDGQKPVSVGFWFSLGHSSVVFGLCLLLSFGVRALAGQVEDGDSTLQTTFGLIGTMVSGVFLVLIGIINLFILRKLVGVFRRMKSGEFSDDELEEHLNKRGFMNRFLGKVTKSIKKPWQMYPLGILFGLGFDTATEVSLLVLAGGAAAFALPWYAILCLPVLFAAGMSLLDTIDGCFMNFAYGWAFSQPVRKVYYNITITALSVFIALVIGTVELVGVAAEKAGIEGGVLGFIGGLDLGAVGFIIVGLVVVTWAVAIVGYKVGNVEERWSANLRDSESG
jgi:high-affinity nickel-transport protein